MLIHPLGLRSLWVLDPQNSKAMMAQCHGGCDFAREQAYDLILCIQGDQGDAHYLARVTWGRRIYLELDVFFF